MQNQLHKLNETEKGKLMEAPILITLLIAGADGNIDEKELDWAEKVTHFRRETAHFTLQNYYETVGEDFNQKLKDALAKLPTDGKERTAAISNQLAELNPVLKKLDEHYREKLVESYRTLAEQVAEGSGGILGFFSVNKDEEVLMQLRMIEF